MNKTVLVISTVAVVIVGGILLKPTKDDFLSISPSKTGSGNEPLENDQGATKILHSLLAVESPEQFQRELGKLNLRNGFVYQVNGGVILRELAGKWFKRDTKYALEMIGELPDRESRYYALLYGKQYYLAAAEEFLAFADANLTPTHYRSIRTEIFVSFGKTNPKKGLVIAQGIGFGERRETAITRLFSSWSKTDLSGSLSHIQELKFPEDKAAAYRAIANSGANYTAADLEMIG